MTKARILANIVSTGSVLADGSVAATGITGAVPIASGGTGATTRQDAINALAGALTAGHYLRGHDNGVAMSGILAEDVPTLNQNTTGSAATLTTPRTISITGDVAYTSGAFDGSSNTTGVATLSNSGVTAGTYGSDTNIPQLAVDSKGRVTSVTNVAVSIPSGALTFTGDVTGTGSTGATTDLTLAATGTAGTYTKVTTDSKGRVTSGTTLAASDIPALDASKIISGTIDAARLPSYVDDVVEAANLAGFPTTGETGKIYVALDTNKAYRWSGSAYIYITSGAVDSVAGRTGVVTLTSSDVGLGSVENKSSATIRGEITSSNVTTALGFTPYNSTNPSGYITSSALSSYLPLSGGTLSGKLTINATAGLDLNRLTFDADGTDSFYRALSGNRHRFTTTGGADFIIGNASGAVTINGNQVLHAGNYNSYAPTLTGTGASGTWGINITGSAGSAGTATTATNLSGGTVAATTGSFSGVLTLTSPMGNGDAPLRLVPSSSSGTFQWASTAVSASLGAGQTMAHFIGNALNPGNSGYLGFNYTGAASGSNYVSLGHYANDNILRVYYATYTESSGSMRAPIFYDSNDTGYYTDPASSTSLYTLRAGSGSLNTSPAGTLFSHTLAAGVGSSRVVNFDGVGTQPSVWWSNGSRAYGAIDAQDPGLTIWANNGSAWQKQISVNYGNVTIETDIRSPIFYDSDNTGYFVSPNSFSQLSYGNFNAAPSGRTLSLGGDQVDRVYDDSSRSSLVINGAYYPHLYINATANNGNANHGAVLSMTGNLSAGGYRRWGMGIANTNPDCFSWGYYDNNPNPHYGVGGGFGYTDTNSKMWLNTSGSLWTTGDMRSPIFYDSNNTGYYLNPETSSVLNTLYLTGVYTRNSAGTGYMSGNYSSSETSSTTGAIYTIGGSYVPTSTSFGTMYGVGYCYASGISVGISGASGWGFYVNGAGVNKVWLGGESGQVISAGDHRGTVFYDYNDTNYYVDPATNSNLAALSISSTTGNTTKLEVSGSTGQLFSVTDSMTGTIFSVNDISGIPSIEVLDTGLVKIAQYSGNVVLGSSADNTTDKLQVNGSVQATTIKASTDARAPLFYDQNDTGYYLDPNGSSLMSSLNVNGNFRANFVSGGGGTTFTASHYSMGKDVADGGWSHPHYSDLIIGYHTGVRIGAHYSGTRFYSNSPTTDANNDGNGDGGEALLMTVGGYVGTANHTDVFVNNNLLAGASLRAPLFYDNNDTGYYIDPNSTSDTALRMRGGGLFGPNTSWGAYLYVGTNGNIDPNTATVAATNGNLHLDAKNGYLIYLNNYATSSYTVANQSIRSPIFYDYDNTAFYTDPASRSVLSSLNIGSSTTIASGALSVFAGGAGSVGWGTGINLGDASNYTTFIQDAGTSRWRNTGAGGFDYYNSAGSMIMALTNSGTLNVPVSDVRAPIFYDSNNTGYYVDPASTSNLNVGNFAGSSSFTASTYCAYMYGNGDTGSTSGVGMNVYSSGGSGAMMAFHRGGYYAVNMGLDSDNVFRIGGWSASANRLQMDMSGNLTMAGNVTAYSDIRLKENIEVIANAVDRVKQIRGVTFTRNDDENKTKRHAGVIAQEVEMVLPEVVSTDNSGIKNVAYGNMVGLLVEAIKEQQNTLTLLIETVKQQQNQINELKKLLEK